MLEKIFLQILNMSFTASFVIIFVLIARLLLKKSPKILSYVLWGVVLFRLICPLSFESIFSLLPAKTNPISQDIVYAAIPTIDTGIPAINHSINTLLPAATPYSSINPLQIWVFIGTTVWLLGIAVLLIYSIFSLLKLQNHLKNTFHERDNIYLVEHLETPFVMGIIRPKIYLPTSLIDEEKRYILLHEEIHIRRLDHVVKILSFFVLCLHWFNPLVWVAFFISNRDMEMSCNEAVIKQLGSDVKKEYSTSLLSLSTGRHIIGGTPLAFGEGDTKDRIKNILNYKKPTFWAVIFSFMLVTALGIGFATNQKADRNFVMSGSYLSDLQPEEITRNIAEIIKADIGDIKISPDNFGLMVSSNFKWVNDEAIRILYPKDGKLWNTTQLRIFIEDSEFFMTEPRDWIDYDGQIFLLQHYLEALRYLPEEEITNLCKEKPQRYAIELSENDRKLNVDRCIYYDKNGVTPNNGWQIRLDIQPLYGDNESSLTGVGNDIIHVFYNGISMLSPHDFASASYQSKNNLIAYFEDGTEHTITPTDLGDFLSQTKWEEKHTDPLELIASYKLNINGTILSLYESEPNLIMLMNPKDYRYRYYSAKNAYEMFLKRIQSPKRDGVMATLTQNANPLEVAIHNAILDREKDNVHNADFITESHIILATESATPDSITVYALVFVGKYNFTENGFTEEGGSHIPTAITFNLTDKKEYKLKEYWVPRDVSYYASDIKSKFPKGLYDEVMDDTKYILAQVQNCYAQAIEYGNVNTEKMISNLIDDIASMTNDSSNWRLAASKRELTYFEEYMLSYAYSRFLQGNQTHKKAEIMEEACRSILSQYNEDIDFASKKGQEWFDAYYAHIKTYEAKEGLNFVKENMPKGYLLLTLD